MGDFLGRQVERLWYRGLPSPLVVRPGAAVMAARKRQKAGISPGLKLEQQIRYFKPNWKLELPGSRFAPPRAGPTILPSFNWIVNTAVAPLLKPEVARLNIHC